MLFAFLGLGIAELIVLLACFGILPAAGIVIGVVLWQSQKNSKSRKELGRFDEDDDTAIQVRKP